MECLTRRCTSQQNQANTSALSPATKRAIAIFRRHHAKRFYSERMVKVETAAMAEVPESELAEFVRITTKIQNS